MTFEEYQKLSRKTAIYPDKGNNFIYPVLGLAGEAGEVSEKIKKILRDKAGTVNQEDKTSISKELGDVLWYIAQIATELNISLDSIAENNIEKLFLRKQKNSFHGEGDNR